MNSQTKTSSAVQLATWCTRMTAQETFLLISKNHPVCSVFFALHMFCCSQSSLKHDEPIVLGLQMETKTLPQPKSLVLSPLPTDIRIHMQICVYRDYRLFITICLFCLCKVYLKMKRAFQIPALKPTQTTLKALNGFSALEEMLPSVLKVQQSD